MEVAGGIPPAEIDISVTPDMLQTATSMTTEVSYQEWMEIDTPDPVESGMETTGGSPPAVSDINVDTDVLQTAISEMRQVSEKWMVILRMLWHPEWKWPVEVLRLRLTLAWVRTCY